MRGVERGWGIRLSVAAACMLCCALGATAAQAPADIGIRELAEGVWLHTSYYTYPNGSRYPSNGLIVQEGDELTLVDTAWGELETSRLLETIAARLRLPVTRALVTHSHGDRVAGVDVLESHGVEVHAHPLTRRLTTESGLPVPDRTLEGLSDRGDSRAMGRLEILFPGPAHAPDNLTVWLPAERILFGGCAVRAAASSSAGNTTQADLDAWIEAVSLLEKRYEAAEIVVPGHGEPGGPELLGHTGSLVRAAREQSEARAGTTFSGRARIEALAVGADGEGIGGVGLSLCPLASDEVHAAGDESPCRFKGSGEDGVAVFEGVEPGRYRLTASLTGFADTMVFPLSIGVADLGPRAPDRVTLVLNPVIHD